MSGEKKQPEREITLSQDVLEEVVNAASRFALGHSVSVSSRAIHELAKIFGARLYKNDKIGSDIIEVQIGRVVFAHSSKKE